FAPIPKSDERFARQYRFGPPPEFPLASPRSGIVHHLSGPDMHAPTRTLHRRSGSAGGATPREGSRPLASLCLPGFPHPSTRTHVRTPWSVFQDGSDGEPTGRCLGRTCAPRGTPMARVMSSTASTPWTEFTARLGLHSQTTRLVDSASWCDRVRAGRGSHPPRRPFPGDLARSVAEDASPDYNSDDAAARFSSWA
ncbi:unnamed protein product, partial [Musa hybrid cultivar]